MSRGTQEALASRPCKTTPFGHASDSKFHGIRTDSLRSLAPLEEWSPSEGSVREQRVAASLLVEASHHRQQCHLCVRDPARPRRRKMFSFQP